MVTEGGVCQLGGGVPPSSGTVPEHWGSPRALCRGATSFRSGRKGLTALRPAPPPRQGFTRAQLSRQGGAAPSAPPRAQPPRLPTLWCPPLHSPGTLVSPWLFPGSNAVSRAQSPPARCPRWLPRGHAAGRVTHCDRVSPRGTSGPAGAASASHPGDGAAKDVAENPGLWVSESRRFVSRGPPGPSSRDRASPRRRRVVCGELPLTAHPT